MSFLDAFKISMVDVVEEAKKGNDEFADSLLDLLFNRLDEELHGRLNFTSVHSAIHDINTHLSVISSHHKSAAEVYYQVVKDKELRNPLVGFYSKYLRALSIDDFPLCCKSIFQQIETIVSYLLHKRELIEKMPRDVKFMEKYKTFIKSNKSGGYFVPLFVKLILIGNGYSKELSKAMINSEYSSLSNFSLKNKVAYDACYSLRNFDSHGKSFYADGMEDVSLVDFQKNVSYYLDAPLQLIGFLLRICIELDF